MNQVARALLILGATLGLFVAGNLARPSILANPQPQDAAARAVPAFSNPLVFTNPFFPFQVGGIFVFRGKSEVSSTYAVDHYLPQTRLFNLGGVNVECRIQQESAFEDGKLIEISVNYFAQGDDGHVYYFGETVDNYINGVVDNHDGSWLVGGPTLPTDPPGTAIALTPGIIMIANPQVGAQFKPEDLPPIVDETVTIKALNVKVRVPGVTTKVAIQIQETSTLPGSVPEFKWYAPGYGVVQVKGKGEYLALVASTVP